MLALTDNLGRDSFHLLAHRLLSLNLCIGPIVTIKIEQTSFLEATALLALCAFGGLQYVIPLNRSDNYLTDILGVLLFRFP